MDQWKKSLREDKFQNGTKSPSFSSTLLDAIYRSIDEGDREGKDQNFVHYREAMKKKQNSTSSTRRAVNTIKDEEEMESFRKACMIEKWMEKKVSEKVVVRRKSVPDFDRKLNNNRSSTVFHSTSSSSDSSCGGVFSSSEAESVHGSRSSSFTSQKPKPVRTGASIKLERPLNFEERKSNVYEIDHHEKNSVSQHKQKHEGRFNKTKSRALKIYGDLKKVKQPISPGGRLANFLNSMFTARNTKKAKIGEDLGYERKSKSAQASTCSSASSFSRSCLSKTPSRGKLINGIQRSVRFYPVSVIVDEDSRPCGHKCLFEDDPNLMLLNEELKNHLVEKNRRVEEASRDLLRVYLENREKNNNFGSRDRDDYEDEEDEDDAASCSSSDLFELDNLSAIGIERYREELPVYETTHLETNRAIASGFIL